MGIDGVPPKDNRQTAATAVKKTLPASAPHVAAPPELPVGADTKPGSPDWGAKDSSLSGQNRSEAQKLVTEIESTQAELASVLQGLVAEGTNSQQVARLHATYLLGERPASGAQAKLYDEAAALMQNISARQYDPAAVMRAASRVQELASSPLAKSPLVKAQLEYLEAGRRVKHLLGEQFAPATSKDVGTLLTLGEKAKAGGNVRAAAAIAAFIPQVAKADVIDQTRHMTLGGNDLLAVKLLSGSRLTDFVKGPATTTAHLLEQLPTPPPGAGAEVKATYAEASALIADLIGANRNQFAAAYARGDTGLRQPASVAVDPLRLEKFATLIEKARNSGLVELELTVASLEKKLFPGLALATAAEAKTFAPLLARVRGANQNLTGDNATSGDRIASGLGLMLGPRPKDPAKAKSHDAASSILAKQLTVLRGKPSLDALGESVEMTGLPSAAIRLLEKSLMTSGSARDLSTIVSTVDAAVKGGDTLYAQKLASLGLLAFPNALASDDPRLRKAADRLAVVWDGENTGAFQEAFEPVLAKFTKAIPDLDRLDGEQEEALQSLEKAIGAEYAAARTQNRPPDRAVLKKISAAAIATQQQFLVKTDDYFGKVFTAVERDQFVGAQQLLGDGFAAVDKDPSKHDAILQNISLMFGSSFATFFEQVNTSQRRTREIASKIESIRRKADVAATPDTPATAASGAEKPSATLDELASAVGVSREDLKGVFTNLVLMPEAQFEKFGGSLPEDNSDRSVLVRALYLEAKRARPSRR